MYVANDPVNRIDSLGLQGEYWTADIAPDAFENFSTWSIAKHKWDRKNPAAKVIWTKPCGKDKLLKMEITQKPTPGSGGYVSGSNGVMEVESQYALFHSGAEAIAASRASFYCSPCP